MHDRASGESVWPQHLAERRQRASAPPKGPAASGEGTQPEGPAAAEWVAYMARLKPFERDDIMYKRDNVYFQQLDPAVRRNLLLDHEASFRSARQTPGQPSLRAPQLKTAYGRCPRAA